MSEGTPHMLASARMRWSLLLHSLGCRALCHLPIPKYQPQGSQPAEDSIESSAHGVLPHAPNSSTRAGSFCCKQPWEQVLPRCVVQHPAPHACPEHPCSSTGAQPRGAHTDAPNLPPPCLSPWEPLWDCGGWQGPGGWGWPMLLVLSVMQRK